MGAPLPSATVSRAVAARLLGGQPRYDELYAQAVEGNAKPVPLEGTVRLHIKSTHRELVSENVAALLPGGDPKLKDEVVVFTAHLDHLGIGEPVNGDAIYNGALDNASGSAAVLNIAEQLAAAPRPKRIFWPTTWKSRSLSFTSGGSTSIRSCRHSSMYSASLSVFPMAQDMSAAMYSTGNFALR